MSWRPENGCYPRSVAESICHVFNRTPLVREGHATYVVSNPFTWDDLGRSILHWCEFREDGLWLRAQELDGPADPMFWNPAAEVRGANPLSLPLLPFPFSSNQLAAFMLCGVGTKLSSAYGPWETGPDEELLREVSRSAVRGIEVLRLAYIAYRQSEDRIASAHAGTEPHSSKWVSLMAHDLLVSAPVVLDEESAAAADWGDRFWQRVLTLQDRVGQDWYAWLKMPFVTHERAAFLLSGMSPNMARETHADALIADQLSILAQDGKARILLDWVHDWMELQAGEAKPRRYGKGAADPVAALAPASTEPQAAEAETPAPVTSDAVLAGELPVNRRALVEALRREWPTIERDLQDASKNGLAEYAKAGDRTWFKSRARAWAQSKAKIQATGHALDGAMRALPTLVHRMSR